MTTRRTMANLFISKEDKINQKNWYLLYCNHFSYGRHNISFTFYLIKKTYANFLIIFSSPLLLHLSPLIKLQGPHLFSSLSLIYLEEFNFSNMASFFSKTSRCQINFLIVPWIILWLHDRSWINTLFAIL